MHLETTHGVSITMSQVPPKPQLSGPSDLHAWLMSGVKPSLAKRKQAKEKKTQRANKAKPKSSSRQTHFLHLAISFQPN